MSTRFRKETANSLYPDHVRVSIAEECDDPRSITLKREPPLSPRSNDVLFLLAELVTEDPRPTPQIQHTTPPPLLMRLGEMLPDRTPHVHPRMRRQVLQRVVE